MSIEELFSKRRQIRSAWDCEKVPSKDLIHDLLARALKIAPSKQNLFPFKIHAFGPDNAEERDIVSQICCLYTSGSVNNWEDSDKDANLKGQTNKDAPWVLVFELRQCKPNVFVKEYGAMHDGGNAQNRFTQIDGNRFREGANRTLSAIETGMFIKCLAGLCLENDLAISYIKSFPEWTWKGQRSEYSKNRNTVGLSWDSLPQITEAPLIVVQIGYKANMRDILATNAFDPNRPLLEDKPSIDDIVQFKD
tara:strand:- start:156 stop:905 length:750 start_codon:yes stop_codon:yes gene_type:complete